MTVEVPMIDKQTIFASGISLKKELDLGNTSKRKKIV
jgi:hypothetical protein